MSKWRDTGALTTAQAIDIPPVWLLAHLVLAWSLSRLIPSLTTPFIATKLIGALLVLGGLFLMIWAVAAFRSHQTSVVPHQIPQRIITSGPFARSRNPIYLGDVLVLSGAILWWGSWSSLAVIPLFVWIIARRFIAPEEARMKENFGPEFESFAEKTPRWL